MRTLESRCMRLFGADRLRGAEDAVGPAHAVVQVLVALLDEELAGLALVVDDHRHDVAHLLDQRPSSLRPSVIWLLIW